MSWLTRSNPAAATTAVAILPTGAEFALTLLGATVAILIAGAGTASLDATLARREA